MSRSILGTGSFFLVLASVVLPCSSILAGPSCSSLLLSSGNMHFDVDLQRSAHWDITTDLFNGYVIKGKPFSENQNRNPMFKVQIKNPKTGRVRDAFFKPRQFGDGGGWARMPMEYVSYEVNRKLGMDWVPPMAYRRNFNINGQTFAEGVLIYAVADAKVLGEVSENKLPISQKAIFSDHRVLSVLLQNEDGHSKNMLFGRHWVTGTMMPFFIDFGASLRHGTSVTMTAYPAAGNREPVDTIRRITWEKLQELKRKDLQSLREFITEGEITYILSIRDGIVAYYKRQINSRGESNVILEE